MQELRGRVAVVTGGASGIGRGIAESFAAAGARLVLADANAERLAEATRALAERCDVIGMRVDVRRSEELEALAERADRAFGGVHVLCNNAGVACSGFVWEHSAADCDWIFDTNVRGTLHGLRVFVPRLLAAREPAHIVNTASMLGLMSAPLTGLYGASKHAVLAISESLRADLQLAGAPIGVSVLCPGPVRTNVGEEPGRPAGPAAARTPELERAHASLRAVVAAGMDPRAVGDCVVRGVRRNQFWILPAPEQFAGAERRLAEIRAELSGPDDLPPGC